MCEGLPKDFANEIRALFSGTPGEAEALLSAMREPAKCAFRWMPQRSREAVVLAKAVSANASEVWLPAANRQAAAAAVPPLVACTTQVPWEPQGVYYDPDAVSPGKHVLHEAGAYYVQEPSAMAPAAFLVEGLFRARGFDTERAGRAALGEATAAVGMSGVPLRILDLCAAPGGKATQLAGHLYEMAPDALLIANEPVPSRAKILSENIERCGVSNVIVTSMEPAALAERFPAYFDAILVDAPCSGEGMFRKHPEVMTEWSLDVVTKCAMRQAMILDEAAKMLAPGGRLVYSTCTFNKEENEDTIIAFLTRNPYMKLMNATAMQSFTGGMTPGIGLPETVRLLPQHVRGEGHFLAVMERAAADEGDTKNETQKPARKKPNHRRKETAAGAQHLSDFPAYQNFAKEYLPKKYQDGAAYAFGEQLYQFPAGAPPLDGLKVFRPGLHLGTLKKDRFEPAHALSHVLTAEEFPNTKALTEEEAKAWIRGETFRQKGAAGWYLLTVYGIPLGFGKCAGGVMKNHYPKGLRKTL